MTVFPKAKSCGTKAVLQTANSTNKFSLYQTLSGGQTYFVNFVSNKLRGVIERLVNAGARPPVSLIIWVFRDLLCSITSVPVDECSSSSAAFLSCDAAVVSRIAAVTGQQSDNILSSANLTNLAEMEEFFDVIYDAYCGWGLQLLAFYIYVCFGGLVFMSVCIGEMSYVSFCCLT